MFRDKIYKVEPVPSAKNRFESPRFREVCRRKIKNEGNLCTRVLLFVRSLATNSALHFIPAKSNICKVFTYSVYVGAKFFYAK
jgi:hypothetical protein